MVRVIEGKIGEKRAEGKQKLLRVSGRFKLLRVRVTESKITVNVRRKSRGNRLWFKVSARVELATVRVIGSQPYIFYHNFVLCEGRESYTTYNSGVVID